MSIYADLPVTKSHVPRPVYARFLRRMEFGPLDPPTEAERQDAIRVLCECYPVTFDIDEVLLSEAERIFIESDVG